MRSESRRFAPHLAVEADRGADCRSGEEAKRDFEGRHGGIIVAVDRWLQPARGSVRRGLKSTAQPAEAGGPDSSLVNHRFVNFSNTVFCRRRARRFVKSTSSMCWS